MTVYALIISRLAINIYLRTDRIFDVLIHNFGYHGLKKCELYDLHPMT